MPSYQSEIEELILGPLSNKAKGGVTSKVNRERSVCPYSKAQGPKSKAFSSKLDQRTLIRAKATSKLGQNVLDWKKQALGESKKTLKRATNKGELGDSFSSCNFIEDEEDDCEIAEEEFEQSATSQISSSRLTSSEAGNNNNSYPV